MLKPEFRQLYKQGVTHLCQGSASDEAVIVQVYNLTLTKNKLACFVSDGRRCVKCFIKQKDLLIPEKHENSIIRVKQHMVDGNGKKIGILDFDLICQYSQLLGNPEPFDETNISNPEEAVVFEIDPKKITMKHMNMFEEKETMVQSTIKKNTKPIKVQSQTEVKEQRKEMRVPDARPLNGSVKDYETIAGLFVGLKNWHLLCRICKMDYQEFKKKNENRMVRILTIELIDRSQVKISGSFFQDAADKFRDILKVNSVYKISEGKITNETYNNSRNEKMSPFKLMFYNNSLFEQVSDVQIISKSEDSAITLSDVLTKRIYDQEFDILGILIEIEDPKDISKGEKTLIKWNWVIADPLQEKKIHAVLWNDKVKPNYSLIGKTVLLSNFILHNYNGSLTLNSKARSSIQLANYAPYQNLQEQTLNNAKNFELLSERRAKDEDNTNTVIYKNSRDLLSAIETMSSGETLKSDLDVFINRLLMKKWYYEGCPGCNKSAEKGTSCHCGKYVQQTVPHFILTVQFADAGGSLFSTAYDEQAKRVFWDEENVIHKLLKFDQKQLKDVVQDYYFQQFKVRLYTKRDNEGRIKHNMGRLEHIAPEKCAKQNVERIKEMMGL